MSVQKRKLSHWSIEFTSGDEHHFDPPLFSVFYTMQTIYLRRI